MYKYNFLKVKMDNIYFTEIELKSIKKEFLAYHIEVNFDIPLETIFRWIDCLDEYEKYIKDEDYRETFCQINLYKFQENDYIMINKNNIDMPLFTLKGCKSFCKFYSAKSRHLLIYLTEIENKYKYKKYDIIIKMQDDIEYLKNEVAYLKQEVRNNRRD